MKRSIWIRIVLVASLLLVGCQSGNISTVEPVEEKEEISENQMWLPITHSDEECILYDYYNQRIVAYSLTEKQVCSENKLDNFFQYCFYSDCDVFTSGHSTEGFFKIVKKERNAVKQLLAVNDKGSIFPCGCDVNRKLYFFNRSYEADESKRRIVQLENGKLMEYKNTGGNIMDGLLYKDILYYTVYDEEKDYYLMKSIDIGDYNCKPKDYGVQLDDSVLFEYDSQIYVADTDKIYSIENKQDSYHKKNFNFFDKKNNKLIQMDVNTNTEVELSIVNLKTRKVEYVVSNPISFECQKGLITIYGDGFIEEYRTEDD